MTQFKAVSGAWSKNAEDDFKGTCDASLSARAIVGSEEDEDYEFYVKVKPGSGKAAVIVNYTVDVDWHEHYLEMVLDPTAGTIVLDAVDRDENGVETSRVALSSFSKTLAYSTEYLVRMVSKLLDDESYAVYGYVDDFMFAQAEDLASPYQKGMHGIESLGVLGNLSDYSVSWGTASLTRLKQLLEITAATWDTELTQDMRSAYLEIQDALKSVGISAVLNTEPVDILHEAQAQLAASKFRGRRAGQSSQTGAKAFMAEFQRVLQVFQEGNREVTSTRG
jgi:hypothetical protein